MIILILVSSNSDCYTVFKDQSNNVDIPIQLCNKKTNMYTDITAVQIIVYKNTTHYMTQFRLNEHVCVCYYCAYSIILFSFPNTFRYWNV